MNLDTSKDILSKIYGFVVEQNHGLIVSENMVRVFPDNKKLEAVATFSLQTPKRKQFLKELLEKCYIPRHEGRLLKNVRLPDWITDEMYVLHFQEESKTGFIESRYGVIELVPYYFIQNPVLTSEFVKVSEAFPSEGLKPNIHVVGFSLAHGCYVYQRTLESYWEAPCALEGYVMLCDAKRGAALVKHVSGVLENCFLDNKRAINYADQENLKKWLKDSAEEFYNEGLHPS